MVAEELFDHLDHFLDKDLVFALLTEAQESTQIENFLGAFLYFELQESDVELVIWKQLHLDFVRSTGEPLTTHALVHIRLLCNRLILNLTFEYSSDNLRDGDLDSICCFLLVLVLILGHNSSKPVHDAHRFG